jgi:hypothetical protein
MGFQRARECNVSQCVLGGELVGYIGCGPEFLSRYSPSERSDSAVCSGGLYCNMSIERYTIHYVNL